MVLVKNEKRQQKNVDKNIILLDKIDWAKKFNDKKNNLM